MAKRPKDLFAYSIILMDGVKIEGLGPEMSFAESAMGGIAPGSDGNQGAYMGTGRDYTINNLTIIPRNDFDPDKLEKMLGTGIRSISYNLGDPAFGGKRIEYVDLFNQGQTVSVNNYEGKVAITFNGIKATRKRTR